MTTLKRPRGAGPERQQAATDREREKALRRIDTLTAAGKASNGLLQKNLVDGR